ncbi:MAG: UDP-phosphate alpha N-acetylglucosaminyltransferase [Alphaproteobacteria bacterium]|nr:UDP-phosphate alpha N-acetylglucosaminyltransferase [Rhizobiaceae bacterium]MBU3960219.1 UDP-phosphate alpha N-acetylglucosaminyltransferase [Alphaproteobacteria bacterium]MBU4048548.1 UDP-phosphate alpha N-acetylglucosaminyltransferase [Alphaproteobacteria bacterium]MBU4088877.1 UDP-phosphate alpha N-acetylglucosaminyltransferase [Alphaproteobacteria bacterium]MBU4157837.1 UDP-phosphate alpha N-acetylglucosaminyltransferase [Alphaproteobacteria bacterium]
MKPTSAHSAADISPAPGHSAVDRVPGTALDTLRRQLATIAVLGGLTFNAFLCFLNTNVMGIRESHVMLFEMALIGCAYLAALSRRIDLYLVSAFFLSYMLLLFALRGEIDLKAVRDVLIPIGFYFMGTQVRDIRLADRLVTISIAIVLVFGLFEYFLTELYLDFFNVLGYFIARGSLTLEDTFGATRGLFISGLRPEPRTLLSFLGQHRVSSVFLEPVSAGNFGAIVFAWALFRTDMRYRFVVMAAAIATVILADARFGFYTCILMTLMLPFYRLVAKPVWMVLPFLLLALIAVYGLATGTDGGANDIAGRFKVTAAILTRLDLPVVLGIATTDEFTADSGLAYTLTKFGLFGFVALWAALVFAPFKDAKAWSFHSMVLIYLLLLMIISNSFFSIKTAALLWFVLGTAHWIDWSKRTARPAASIDLEAVSARRSGPLERRA